MSHYIVGVQQGSRNAVDTVRDLQRVLRHQGTAQQVNAPAKFRSSSLDVLMFVNDRLAKLEGGVDNILKKVERQYLDVKEVNHHKWIINTPEGDMDQVLAIQKFRWNESKFKLDLALPKLADVFEHRANFVENEVRQKAQNFNDVKGQLQHISPKEGNIFVRDLADVLTGPAVKLSDFVYSKFLNTVVAIVPKGQVEAFLAEYESLSEYVVPSSAKQFKGLGEKEGLTIWRVALFNVRDALDADQQGESYKKTITQEFADGCRDKLKAVVREFKYKENLFEERARDRKELQEKCKVAINSLASTCEVSFSEMFTLGLHVKMMRVMIECQLRFGTVQVAFSILTLKAGKEKDAMKALTQSEGREDSGMYGTKDEIEDTEDFFPFVSMPMPTF